MTPALTTLCEHLHLRHLATVLPTWLERAAQDELGYAEFLQGLLEEGGRGDRPG